MTYVLGGGLSWALAIYLSEGHSACEKSQTSEGKREVKDLSASV